MDLRKSTIDSSLVFVDIGMFAHRLRGAALVFEFGEIGDAAKALELAAAVAAVDDKEPRECSVAVSAMQALATELAKATGSAHLPRAGRMTESSRKCSPW
jgi:hypothetical protein